MTEREIFLAALKKSSATERAAFLEQACGADANLRGHINALLVEHDQLGSYLESPAAASQRTVDDPPATERPGMMIGPYKLLQQIGEGGMGVVWMAEQTQPVQRTVALKVIKPGMDSRQVIARFEAERQALALMDHVNIARVFDGGTVGQAFQPDSSAAGQAGKADQRLGRPYFVMELVHGVPITNYCDDNHLTPRERLELFVPVCQAIQHAHQKGIIHRDIKPSNVMVTLYDGKPVPKVIDFGVAKATEQKLTERTLFTQYGTMVGTLEYMSPEQAEMSALGVDTRSDIYSLGVLLYELLTGSTPLTHKRMKEAAYAEILRMIKEEEPPKPSTRLSDSGEALASISANRHTEPAKLAKLVKGELDWIVMKTLEKDRNRRYETAKDVAADVQRYLNDEPIQARAITMPQRMWRWYRRHVPLVAGAYTVFTFAIIGVMGIAMASTVQFLITSPNGTDVLTALGTFPVFALLIFLGVESGIAAFRGKRRGLWISLIAFGLIGLTSWWGLYWSIVISRELSAVPVASVRVLRPDTFDGSNAYVRNCVIGYALLNVIWYSVGFVLQVHALVSEQPKR
jgi:serine/threonine protein kinase